MGAHDAYMRHCMVGKGLKCGMLYLLGAQLGPVLVLLECCVYMCVHTDRLL